MYGICRALKLRHNEVHVTSKRVGGGFGGKVRAWWHTADRARCQRQTGKTKICSQSTRYFHTWWRIRCIGFQAADAGSWIVLCCLALTCCTMLWYPLAGWCSCVSRCRSSSGSSQVQTPGKTPAATAQDHASSHSSLLDDTAGTSPDCGANKRLNGHNSPITMSFH